MIAPDISLGGTSLITRLAAKQNTLTNNSLVIATTSGLQTALDAKQNTLQQVDYRQH